MTDLPVRFPRDPYCRAGTRLMLTCGDGAGELYLGLTPDGAQPGRDMLARLTTWRGETPAPFTAAQEDGKIVLRAEGGYIKLSLGLPERLLIEGEGLSLLIGKGRAVGMFMSGGSAVDDPLPGALYVNAGARMRILAERGRTEVRSAWNLNALSDPDPRIFLHPDEDGVLRAAVYVTDFDAAPEALDAPAAPEDFEAFLRTLIAYPSDAETLHAAYVVWSCLQPVRRLAAPQITAPVYVSNRRTNGTALLSDNVLFAALLADPKAALRQMCGFLEYQDELGLLPRAADNRRRLYEAETPYFGVVLRARPDVRDAIGYAEFERLSIALDWWRHERYCREKQAFFYRHRYEPGFGARYPFPDEGPSFDPALNACMRMWLEEMVSPAQRAGDRPLADAYCDDARPLPNALTAPEEIPEPMELPLLLAGDAAAKHAVRDRLRQGDAPPEITTLRRALTVLAAGLLEEGEVHHAD